MNYQEEALRTLAGDPNVEGELLLTQKDSIDILHAAIGLGTEAGEVLDVVKKWLFYGKEIDRANLIEELGDLEWYMAVLRAALGVTQEEVQERNIAKLRVRYPERFTRERALSRDLEAERKTLE